MAAAHDSVPVSIRVAGKGDVESIPESDDSRHRIHRRRIHADLTIPVDAHEAEGWIDEVIHDLEVEPVAVADGMEIDHRREISYISLEVRMEMRGGRPPSPIKGDSHHPAQILRDEGV